MSIGDHKQVLTAGTPLMTNGVVGVITRIAGPGPTIQVGPTQTRQKLPGESQVEPLKPWDSCSGGAIET